MLRFNRRVFLAMEDHMRIYAYSWALLIALVVSVWSPGVGAQTTAQCDDGSDSCTVTTCDANDCYVFVCTNGDCVLQTSYPNPGGTTPPPDTLDRQASAPGKGSGQLSGGIDESVSGNIRFIHCGQNRCAIRMCSDQECVLFGFDRGASFEIARYKNTQGAADQAVSRFLQDGPSALSPASPDPR